MLVLGGIDLSVGSLLALCGDVMGVTTAGAHWPLPLALLACLAVGAGVGALNGAVMVRWKLPAFIVTLGTRLGAADPNAGGGLELQAIAAVVVGGTSLMGGRGSIVGALLITGLVIVAAVVLDNYRNRALRA